MAPPHATYCTLHTCTTGVWHLCYLCHIPAFLHRGGEQIQIPGNSQICSSRYYLPTERAAQLLQFNLQTNLWPCLFFILSSHSFSKISLPGLRAFHNYTYQRVMPLQSWSVQEMERLSFKVQSTNITLSILYLKMWRERVKMSQCSKIFIAWRRKGFPRKWLLQQPNINGAMSAFC